MSSIKQMGIVDSLFGTRADEVFRDEIAEKVSQYVQDEYMPRRKNDPERASRTIKKALLRAHKSDPDLAQALYDKLKDMYGDLNDKYPFSIGNAQEKRR